MKCEKYQELISLYVDDLLTLDEKKQLEEHLEHCLSCRETLETLFMMKSVMHETEEVEVPKNFHDDLHKRLCQEARPKNKIYKWIPYASGLAAALLIGFVLVDGRGQEQVMLDAPVPMAASLDTNEVVPMPIENEPDAVPAKMQTRGALPQGEAQTQEEIWQGNCQDLEATRVFLEDYAIKYQVSIVEWQLDNAYHWLLEPVEDKNSLKSSLEDEGWIEGPLEVTINDVPVVHLILNVQE